MGSVQTLLRIPSYCGAEEGWIARNRSTEQGIAWRALREEAS